MERKIPLALWISLAAFGAVTLIQLLTGVQEGSGVLLIAVVLNVAVLAGLSLGHKWAYVATLALALGGLLTAPGRSAERAIVVLIGNGLVIVPLVISTRFFFPGRPVDVTCILKRFWPLIVIAAGLFLYLGGTMHEVGYAGIPYQDPTPEMSADYAYHAHIASTICRLGTGVFLFGVLCGMIWFGVGLIRLAVRRFRSRIVS